jgi:hypothetical protein
MRKNSSKSNAIYSISYIKLQGGAQTQSHPSCDGLFNIFHIWK